MMSIKRKWWLWILLASLLLSACGQATSAPNTPAADLTPATPLPSLRFVNPPTLLCRNATQLRLRPIVEGAWPADTVATWDVRPTAETTVIAEGTWTLKERDLFIALPDGTPIIPGDYVFTFYVNDTEIAEHAFTVQATSPQLEAISLGLTPSGPEITTLQERPRVFYVRYTYDAVCPGTPLWITVTREGETILNRDLTLQASQGAGSVACYLEDGGIFEPGRYEATLTLAGGEERHLDFELGKTPEPEETETPDVQMPVCETPLTAMGLTPGGEPYRPLERFEWYTQAVYVVTDCRNIPDGLRWIARWYRNGEEVRVHRGQWTGDESGVIWDTLTGTEEAPFLRAGTYTTTLSLGGSTLLETDFRVIPYVPAEE